MAFSFQLSRKWRERLRRWGRTTVSYVTYPYFMLVGAVSWFIALIIRSWHTRHFRYLLQGFPAVVVAAGVCVAGVFVAKSTAQEQRANLAKDYLIQVSEVWRKASSYTDADDKDKSKRREQLGLARMYLEKALSLEGGDKDEYKFYLAKVLEQSAQLGSPEDLEQCLAIMYKLAPDGSNGYLPAHLWRAIYLDVNCVKVPVFLAAIENHLSRAYEIAKSDPESNDAILATFHLSNFLVSARRFSDAIPLLEKIEGKIPQQRLVLGAVYEAVNRKPDADKMYQSAEKYYRNETEKKLDNKEAWLILGRALMAQKKYEQAIAAYQKAIVITRDQRFLLDAAEAYRLWELELAQKPDSNVGQRLGLIQKGLEALPNHPRLLGRLYEISIMKGPEGEKAQVQIREMLSNGIQEPILYFIMGSHAYNEGRKDDAMKYWKKARENGTDMTADIIDNNLALLMAYDDKNPDPEKALAMSEQVNANRPGQPNFMGTRGQILVKLKRYADAIPDLLKALKVQPADIGLNEAIAEAYEATGVRDMAEEHRKKIAMLKERAAKQKLESPLAPTLPNELEPPKPADPKPELPKPKIGDKPPGI